MPRDSMICKMPKNVVDSMAMTSPGLATARNQTVSAAVAASAEVITGLGTGFKNAAVFEQAICLGDSGDADVLLLAAFADGRDALARAQGAVFDEFGNAEGDLFVKAILAVELRGGMGGQVLRQHSEKVSRIVQADNDT